jgi:hypothetical protein
MIVGIHLNKCGCVEDEMELWERKVPNNRCDRKCGNYQNPLCGGPSTDYSGGESESNKYWNLFIEYEHQSFGSHGSYDPWRYVWYTVVVVR